MEVSRIPPRVLVRYLDAVEVRGPDECWGWDKSVGSHGYGQIGWQDNDLRSNYLAHRIAFAIYHGEIPWNLTVDHLCHVKTCQNPNHLRLLPNVDNARDNGQGAKTHCPQGHPYGGDNLYIDGRGHRRCNACRRMRRRT
jgi:hypothetical protein